MKPVYQTNMSTLGLFGYFWAIASKFQSDLGIAPLILLLAKFKIYRRPRFVMLSKKIPTEYAMTKLQKIVGSPSLQSMMVMFRRTCSMQDLERPMSSCFAVMMGTSQKSCCYSKVGKPSWAFENSHEVLHPKDCWINRMQASHAIHK